MGNQSPGSEQLGVCDLTHSSCQPGFPHRYTTECVDWQALRKPPRGLCEARVHEKAGQHTERDNCMYWHPSEVTKCPKCLRRGGGHCPHCTAPADWSD